jgi:hypothetical protein
MQIILDKCTKSNKNIKLFYKTKSKAILKLIVKSNKALKKDKELARLLY